MSSEKQGKKRGGVRRKPQTNQNRSRRSDFKYPSLEPSVALLKRKAEVEDVATYVDQLNDEEKAWMNQFMKEYNEADTESAVFHNDEILRDKDGYPIMTTNRWGVIDENSVPMTARKLCNDRNNSRNRCWYTEEAAANRLNLVESEFEMEKMLYSEIDPHVEDDD